MSIVLLNGLLALGLLGLVTSTIYLGMVCWAALRFRRRSRPSPGFTPPVSLLKPLHGAEPGLRDFLEGFFHLDYPCYEILFCARHDSDAGLAVARDLCEEHPEIPARIITSGEPAWPNARCFSLDTMKAEARYDFLVITDSDVRVTSDYLRSVMAPLSDKRTGMVTCIYRGVAPQGGFWAQLEALGMSVEMTSGVLVADMLEGMRFALGPSMVVRKRCVEQIGGFQRLGRYYADDFMLGHLVSSHGNAVGLSHHVIDHCVVNNDFKKSLHHQWNWMKSTRFSRPLGHLGTGLTFAVPFGILSFVAAALLGHSLPGALALLWTVGSRVLHSALIGRLVVRDPSAVRLAWLYPLRDLLGSMFWAASYMSRRVGWRDDRFELSRGGLVRLLPATPPKPSPAPRPERSRDRRVLGDLAKGADVLGSD